MRPPQCNLVPLPTLSALANFPNASAHCCITSPLFASLEEVVTAMREVHRILRPEGTLWLHLQEVSTDDAENLRGHPWKVAFALRDAGWYLRSDIILVGPETTTTPDPPANLYNPPDRPDPEHTYLFLFSKREKYFYDAAAVREPNAPGSGRWGGYNGTKTAEAQTVKGEHGKSSMMTLRANHTEMMARYYTQGRNRRSVWRGADFFTMLAPAILAGTSAGGCCTWCRTPYLRGEGATFAPACACEPRESVPCTVLDPFAQYATGYMLARAHGRNFLGGGLDHSTQEAFVEEWKTALCPTPEVETTP